MKCSYHNEVAFKDKRNKKKNPPPGGLQILGVLAIVGVRHFLWSFFIFLTEAGKQVEKSKEDVHPAALYWCQMPDKRQSKRRLCTQLDVSVQLGGAVWVEKNTRTMSACPCHSEPGLVGSLRE